MAGLTAAQVGENIIAFKASNGGSLSTPTAATTKNASGQLINSAGQVVGGAMTSAGLSYGDGTIPGVVGNGAITPSALTPTPMVAVPQPPAATANYSGITAGTLASLGLNSDGTIKPSTTLDKTSTATPSLDNLLATSLNLQSQNTPVNESDIYNSLPEKAARDAAQQQVQDYQAKLNGIVAKRDANVLQIRGTDANSGVTEAVYGGQKNEIEREAAIEALPVAAQLSAAQGNLQLAQDHLDTLFKLKVADAMAQYDYKNRLIDTVMKFAGTAEQRQFDAEKTKAANDFTISRDNAATQKDLAGRAITAHRADLLPLIYGVDNKSPDFNKQISTIAAKIPPSDTTLTSTQVSDASVRAGMDSSEFVRLPQDVQNFFSQSSSTSGNLKGITDILTNVKSGDESLVDAQKDIDKLNVGDTVKTFFKNVAAARAKEAPAPDTSSHWYNPFTWFK